MSTVARAAMKCSSNVAMALSAALTRWLCGGMSWMLICSDLMYFSTAAKHSLSITFSAGWYPPVLRVVITSLNAVVHCASDGVGQCGKAKYILHGANFVLGEHVINLGMGSDNVVVIVSCGGSV